MHNSLVGVVVVEVVVVVVGVVVVVVGGLVVAIVEQKLDKQDLSTHSSSQRRGVTTGMGLQRNTQDVWNHDYPKFCSIYLTLKN